MTIEQLEQRVNELAAEVAELRKEIKPLRPFSNIQATFGMFANDPEFDEVVRLGREYRDQVNSRNS